MSPTERLAFPHPIRKAAENEEDPSLLDVETDDQQLLAQIIEYYQRTLKTSQEAIDYLRKRGITNGQVIEQFRIGYSDSTLSPTLPRAQTKAGAEIRGRMMRLGFLRPPTNREHFHGCLADLRIRLESHLTILAELHTTCDGILQGGAE